MKKPALIIVIISALLLSSCGILGSEVKDRLNGTSWTLVSYGNQTLLVGTAMTANFDSGEISGSASCNHYFGSYQAKSGKIQISGLGWTEMACMDPDGIMTQEQEIMRILMEASSYEINGIELEIATPAGQVLIFKSIP